MLNADYIGGAPQVLHARLEYFFAVGFIHRLCMLLLLMVAAVFAVADESAAIEFEFSVIAPLATQSLLLDAVAVGERIVTVGERGHILVSTDSGESWQQAKVPVRTLLTAVYFVDDQQGWAVGHNAVILKTVNGGLNWKLVYTDPEENVPLLDVWFCDRDSGFAVGAYSLFLRTMDGGETWTSMEFLPEDANQDLSGVHEFSDDAENNARLNEQYDIADDDFSDVYSFHLNAIHESSNGHLYIASEAGNLYRSRDQGESWQSLSSPYEGSFFSMISAQTDTLLVMGLRGNLYRSTNAGDSWQKVETSTEEMLTGGVRLENGTVLITGLGGVILVSHDDGKQFDLKSQADRAGYADIVQTMTGEVLTFGESGIATAPRDAYAPTNATIHTPLNVTGRFKP